MKFSLRASSAGSHGFKWKSRRKKLFHTFGNTPAILANTTVYIQSFSRRFVIFYSMFLIGKPICLLTILIVKQRTDFYVHASHDSDFHVDIQYVSNFLFN